MSDLKKTRMGFKDNQNHSLLLLLLLVLRFFLFFFLFAFFFASPEFQAFQPVAMTLFGTECIAVLFGERGSFRMLARFHLHGGGRLVMILHHFIPFAVGVAHCGYPQREPSPAEVGRPQRSCISESHAVACPGREIPGPFYAE